MGQIRLCRHDETGRILEIVNAAAERYRHAIPADRWHEPYMSAAELQSEIEAGIVFSGYEEEGGLTGVMGIQPVRDVTLIRHAYVLPGRQGQGIGGALLRHLRERTKGRILIGTWAAADWAIRFYEGQGFRLVPPDRAADLLRTYWTIPERQIETSVVLEG